MKGLMVYTLRNTEPRDCTNGGISSKYDKFVLTGRDIPGIFEPREDMPELKLVYRRELDYYCAEPVDGKLPGCVGWMFGGNYITTSDSRFPNKYPIPIHDRQETQFQYEALSA
jgi:hypothetical protein